MRKTIIFCFAGRKANMALQLPLIHRVLEQNPYAEYHIWDLARTREDSEYLRSLQAERIEVITDYAGENPWKHFDDVYRFYTDPMFSDHLFIKLDDDVVFLETDRFADFVRAIDANRDTVLSAKVVNNGACTFTQPGLQVGLDKLPVQLLEVHQSVDYAAMCHRYFFDHWSDMLAQPIELLPTQQWLSINLIGYDWAMGKRMADLLKKPSPRFIAGRRFTHGSVLGDEGLVNTLPRTIVQGFLACHLSFGPQLKAMTDHQLAEFLKRYGEIGELYLR